MPKTIAIPDSIKKIEDSNFEVEFSEIANFATLIEGSLIINPRNIADEGNYKVVVKVYSNDANF